MSRQVGPTKELASPNNNNKIYLDGYKAGVPVNKNSKKIYVSLDISFFAIYRDLILESRI